MWVKARRGVCVGVNQHLGAGDTADLDAAMVTFLTGIGAVEAYSPPVIVSDDSIDAPVMTGKKEKSNVA